MSAPGPGDGYRHLTAVLRDKGLFRPRRGYYAGKVALHFAVLAATVVGVYRLGNSWFQTLLAVALAFLLAQMAFIGHDAGHRQVGRTARANDLVGLLHANVLTGFSYGWWRAKHGSHHTHCNRESRDPDIGPGPVVFTPDQARARRGLPAVIARWQAPLFVPLMLLEAVNLHVASFNDLRSRRDRAAVWEAMLIAAHATASTAILLTAMAPLHALVFVVVNQAVLGLHLGLAFSTNHIGMPILDDDAELSFFERQVATSRNLHGRAWLGFLSGGLQFQIEHHLYPSMARANLRRTSVVVQEFCRQRAVDYRRQRPSEAFRDVIRHLHLVGRMTGAGVTAAA